MTSSPLDRIIDLIEAGTATADDLARVAGGREALESVRAVMQERIRRTGDPVALKSLRLISDALESVGRNQTYGFFNNGKRKQPS